MICDIYIIYIYIYMCVCVCVCVCLCIQAENKAFKIYIFHKSLFPKFSILVIYNYWWYSYTRCSFVKATKLIFLQQTVSIFNLTQRAKREIRFRFGACIDVCKCFTDENILNYRITDSVLSICYLTLPLIIYFSSK